MLQPVRRINRACTTIYKRKAQHGRLYRKPVPQRQNNNVPLDLGVNRTRISPPLVFRISPTQCETGIVLGVVGIAERVVCVGVWVRAGCGVEQTLLVLDGRGVVCGLVRRVGARLRELVFVAVVVLLVELVFVPADDRRNVCRRSVSQHVREEETASDTHKAG